MASIKRKRKFSDVEYESYSDNSNGRLSGLSEFSNNSSNGRLFNYSSDTDEEQYGKGVATRRQAALASSRQQPIDSPTTSKKAKLHPETDSNRTGATDLSLEPSQSEINSSPTPGPSTRNIVNSALPPKVSDRSWFDEETKIFENEEFALFIQKQDHQKQKVFRLEDHLFVMRVKFKNNKRPPLLSSVRNIMEQAMEIMVNDLKNHYSKEDNNLIYVTIKQPGNLINKTVL
jgi:hypothetical protein